MLRQVTARTAPLFAVRGTVTGLQVLSRSPVALATRTLATLPSDASTEAKPNRPLSPHVSIYRFPLPALTSITNRATGGALTAGIYTAGALALFGAHDLPVYIDAFKAAVPLLVYPTKLLVSFPFVYHTLAGIRHLYWDYTAKGLTLPEVYTSSYALMGATALLTLGLTFYSI